MAEIDQRLRDLLVAGAQRARHLPVEDQVVGDAPGLVAVLVDPAVAAMRRDRAQDRRPLHAVDLAAHQLAVRQEHVVLHVQDARRVVGALQEGAELAEAEGIVAQNGVEQRAPEHG
jgi:hypothetical protein